MKKFFFFVFIALILFALWANHVWGEDKALKNPAADLPSVPTGSVTRPQVPSLRNPAEELPGVSVPPLFQMADFSGGLNLKAQPNAVRDNEALELNNFLFEIDGGLKVRPGFSKVNSTVISANPIWGLYHYSIPNYGKGFLVGDSTFIYKMTDGGTAADSQIYMDELQGDFTNADSRVNIDQPVDFFNLERKVCRGDKVAFGSTKYEIKQVVYDTTAPAAFKLELTGAASATVSNQAFRIKVSNSTVNKASFIQGNNTVFFSMGGRQNARWNGKLGDMVGIYGQGKIDTVYFNNAGSASRRDTAIVCNSCNFSANELQNKVLAFSAVVYNGHYDSTRRIVTEYRIVLSNSAGPPTRIYYQSTHLDSGVQVGRLQPFLVFNPVYTVVDSGTIDTVSNAGSASLFQIRDAGKNFSDKHLYAGKIIEFLDGAARGVTLVIDGGVRGALGDTLRMISIPANGGFDSTSLPKKGDHYAIYHMGLQAAITELYYDRLVCAGIPNFPNTLRPSETGNPDAYSTSDALTLPEQGGDSITFLANIAGRLVAGQKYRLWMLVGAPPWTGNTVILASDGIGCVAPRSLVKNGEYLYFVGLNSGIPTVFRWQVGALAFNTAGTPSLIGERGLVPLTQKVDTLMNRVNKAYLHKAAAGLYQNHLLVSLPFAPDTNNSGTIAINLLTGAIAQESFFAGLMHNGTAAGDSGQLYFTHDSIGQVLLFGETSDNLDTGKTFRASFQSKWFDFGEPTVLKQGLRWWAQYFRADSVADTARWVVLTDFAATRQDSLVMNGSIGASTAERELNAYIKLNAMGKRLGFRFDGWGVRGNFRLDALRLQLAFRGVAQ